MFQCVGDLDGLQTPYPVREHVDFIAEFREPPRRACACAMSGAKPAHIVAINGPDKTGALSRT